MVSLLIFPEKQGFIEKALKDTWIRMTLLEYR
jgi:hypothetical protein